MMLRTSLTILACALFASVAHGAADTTHVELGVYHCDNDAICEIAENAEFCPLDCTPPPPATTTEDGDDDSSPTSGTRTIEQIVDLFQMYIPILREDAVSEPIVNQGGEMLCEDGSCTVFTGDLTRSVVVSFEDSFGEEGTDVSISPISGNEIVFSWDVGVTMRITRSEHEFPIDPLSGELVYEGSRGTFASLVDRGPRIMYYSLFPKRGDGSYGDPEFVIVKSQPVSEGPAASKGLFTVAVGVFMVAILGFIGRFIFLLI